MPPPNQDLQGQIVHSIRRTDRGIFFLAPNKGCVKALAYTYGLGVEASGIMPHVETTMSNHRQGVFTCLTGLRSKFHQRHHGVAAEQLNGRYDRNGYVWDYRGPTQPVLLDGEDERQTFAFAMGESKEEKAALVSKWDAQGLGTVERTIAYDVLNPVTANLVDSVNSFPGFKITPSDWGKWSVNDRPAWFSKEYPDTTAFMALPPPEWWDNAEFVDTGDARFVVAPATLAAFEARREWARKNDPRGAARLDPNAFELFISRENLERARAHYLAIIERNEDELRQQRMAVGKRILGRAALRKQRPLTTPKGPSPIKKHARYKPRFTGPAKAVQRAYRAHRTFATNHLDSRTRFTADRDFSVTFPAGTVQMALLANVCCRAAPLPEENPMG